MLSLHRYRALIFASSPLPNLTALDLLKLRARTPALQFRLFSTTTTIPLPPMDGGGGGGGGGDSFKFGPYKIGKSEVFYSTPFSYSMVNLRPVLPDVLVCPRREVKRFADLTANETTDLWLLAKAVGDKLERYHQATSLTFTIQDGPQAGQTVPHVHIHIIPRNEGDFEKNDDIYDAIDDKEKELKEKLDLDIERKDRSLDEMAREADIYRALLS